MLRLTSLLDEAVCGIVDLAVLGLIGSFGWGCFRPKAAISIRWLIPRQEYH